MHLTTNMASYVARMHQIYHQVENTRVITYVW